VADPAIADPTLLKIPVDLSLLEKVAGFELFKISPEGHKELQSIREEVKKERNDFQEKWNVLLSKMSDFARAAIDPPLRPRLGKPRGPAGPPARQPKKSIMIRFRPTT
jgi:hypothetical protein